METSQTRLRNNLVFIGKQTSTTSKQEILPPREMQYTYLYEDVTSPPAYGPYECGWIDDEGCLVRLLRDDRVAIPRVRMKQYYRNDMTTVSGFRIGRHAFVFPSESSHDQHVLWFDHAYRIFHTPLDSNVFRNVPSTDFLPIPPNVHPTPECYVEHLRHTLSPNYWILYEIGHGSFAVVLKALHRDSFRVVALKVCISEKKDFLRGVIFEILLLQHIGTHTPHSHLLSFAPGISHPIIPITPMTVGLVLPYLSYELSDVENTEEKVRNIARSMLVATHTLHSMGIWHRDIKPNNIGMTHDFTPFLFDFGMCMSDDESPPLATYVCTRWYRAPELVLRDPAYDSKVDIWSLGVVIADLLNGRPLLNGKDEEEELQLMIRILGNPTLKDLPYVESERRFHRYKLAVTHPPQKWSELIHVSPTGEDFLNHMVRWNPEERWTAEELLQHPFVAPFTPLSPSPPRFVLPSNILHLRKSEMQSFIVNTSTAFAWWMANRCVKT